MEIQEPGRERLRRPLVISACVLAAGVALALLGMHQGDERRAVAALPGSERAAIYSAEGLDVFQTLCGRSRRDDALERECRGKAELLLLFPECDQECQQLARDHLFRSPR